MRTIKKLLPGMDGTKKLVDRYGDKLVCVRYRMDDRRNRKVKTVELIIDESSLSTNPSEIPLNKIMRLDVKDNEALLGRAIRSVGGRWNRTEHVWELPYKQVLAMGLEERIVNKTGKAFNNGNLHKRAPPERNA